jgi:hypothetical protein
MTEEKNLKDYLPFYIGCECQTPLGIMELSSIDIHDQYPVWFRYMGRFGQYTPKLNYEVLSKHGLRGRAFYFNEVKPLLRPLSDLTKEEAKAVGSLLHTVNGKNCRAYKNEFGMWRIQYGNVHGQFWIIDNTIFNQRQTIYLLSKHFDLFGLIESGLAIDKTTLQTQNNG